MCSYVCPQFWAGSLPRAELWFTEPRAMALVLGKASRPLRVSVQVHCLGKPGVTAALALLAGAGPQDGLQSPAEGWTLPVGVARVAGDWGLAWPLCRLAGWKDDRGHASPFPLQEAVRALGRHGRSPGGRPTCQVLLDDSSSGHSQHTFLA